MAMYTMELRNYIEMFSQYEDNLSLDERIEIGRKELFDFEYPFFDETYRPQFERNFINEFYMREIGFETEELFKMRLRNWLRKNMGYYNKLFESELLEYDPLTNSRVDVTHTKENDKGQSDLRNVNQTSNTHGTGSTDSEQVGNVDSTQTTTGSTSQDTDRNTDRVDEQFNRKLEGDTPQNRLQLTTGVDGTGVLEYASKIDEDKGSGLSNTSETEGVLGTSNSSSEGNRSDTTSFNSSDETNVDSTANQVDTFDSDINEVEQFVQNRVGKIGVQSFSKLVQEYRNALLRVEVMIHEEMQELFMLVY